MRRIDYFKITKKYGILKALKAYAKRAYPVSIIYNLFDELCCGVCIYDAEGIKLRSDWIYETQSHHLKYRIHETELSREVRSLLEKLEAQQVL